MSNVSEEQRWAVADTKDMLNKKLLDRIFIISDYLSHDMFVQAFKRLYELMRLLPPEVKKNNRVKPYREKMRSLKAAIRKESSKEPYTFFKWAKMRLILNKNADFLGDALEAVHNALIDWHLRVGYTGVPMKDDVEKPDFEIGEDED